MGRPLARSPFGRCSRGAWSSNVWGAWGLGLERVGLSLHRRAELVDLVRVEAWLMVRHVQLTNRRSLAEEVEHRRVAQLNGGVLDEPVSEPQDSNLPGEATLGATLERTDRTARRDVRSPRHCELPSAPTAGTRLASQRCVTVRHGAFSRSSGLGRPSARRWEAWGPGWSPVQLQFRRVLLAESPRATWAPSFKAPSTGAPPLIVASVSGSHESLAGE